MKTKNKTIALIMIILILISGLSFSIGVYLSMKGHLQFLVKPLQPHFGKKFDNNLNLVNTIKLVKPKYAFDTTTYEGYTKWKKKALPEAYNILGIKKEREKLNVSNVKIIKKEKLNVLIRYKLYFDGNYNVSIPCYLLVPNNAKEPLPALLIPSGVGQGIIETSGQVESYQNGNAQFLAEKGFVILTCENRAFGELGHQYIDSARIHANALIIGKTYYGIALEDQMKALDFLSSLDVVDKERIGIAGVSLGGALSMYLALFDDRIKTAVVMGYLSKHKNALAIGDHALINNIPNLVNYFEMSDIASLIAPKPLLYSNGKYDSFSADEGKEVFLKIQKAYTLMNSTENVQWAEHSGGHTFDNEIAYKFLKEQLID